MSEYKTIFGKAVKALASDPTDAGAEGQIWYNTTTGSFRTVLATGAFISSTPYPIAIFGNMGAGIQTAALSFGGTPPPSTPSSPITTTLEYNGSGWATGGNLSVARRSGFGFGTQTAGLGSTGYGFPTTNSTEEYDGSTWTAGGTYPVSQELGGGCGTQTAGLGCGGGPGPSPSNISNEYNGSSWTASPGTLNTARKGLTVTGIQTAGLAASSADSPTATATEEYNGTIWTTVNSMNTSRASVSFGSGIQTASILYGTPGSLESYDGTNWTNESATMGNPRNSGSSAGTATASLAVGGSPGAFTSHVEEYNFSTQVITPAAWSSGNNLNTGRAKAGGMLGSNSTQNASMVFGGQDPGGVVNLTEEYDGTSWSEQNDLSTARRWHYGAGSQTAALCAGGVAAAGATPVTANSEEYDGSSWTAGNSMGTGRYSGGSGGTQTAAFATGGSPAPTFTNATEEYNGTSWTAGGNLPVSKGYFGGGGTLTAGIVMGIGPSATDSYEYDGSSWASSVTMNRGGSQSTYAGLQTDGISFGGTPTTLTEGYDGTAWSTRPSMGTARYALGGSSGTSTSALGAGGYTPGVYSAATEEFTGETTALNYKTITTS